MVLLSVLLALGHAFKVLQRALVALTCWVIMSRGERWRWFHFATVCILAGEKMLFVSGQNPLLGHDTMQLQYSCGISQVDNISPDNTHDISN